MKHIHLMGICGTAMASLAGLLKEQGYMVTGSDSNPYPPMSTQIESLGIRIQKPYSKKNLDPCPDFVVIGNVISANNEEALAVVEKKIPHTSLPKAIGEWFIAERESIVIAGTHGKTTTTSMMAWICEALGLQPGFLIGGIAKNFAKSFQGGVGKYFVIEGDEYDTAYFDKVPKFVHYRPRHVILTSVEFDHADIYRNLEDVKAAFRELLIRIPQEGHILYHAEDPNILSLHPEKCPGAFGYGIQKGDYRAQLLRQTAEGQEFELTFQNKIMGHFLLPMTGQHNLLNATGVLALCHQLQFNLDEVQKALSGFLGVKRRQEILGEPSGILIIEDFAHHPTAVRETLLGLSARYQGRRMIAVFEPRSATSRRRVFQDEYLKAFESASVVLVAKAFDQSKIELADRFSSEELVDGLKKKGKLAVCFSGANEIVSHLGDQAQKGDIVVIMSNGGFDGIYEKLLKRLGGGGT